MIQDHEDAVGRACIVFEEEVGLVGGCGCIDGHLSVLHLRSLDAVVQVCDGLAVARLAIDRVQLEIGGAIFRVDRCGQSGGHFGLGFLGNLNECFVWGPVGLVYEIPVQLEKAIVGISSCIIRVPWSIGVPRGGS